MRAAEKREQQKAKELQHQVKKLQRVAKVQTDDSKLMIPLPQVMDFLTSASSGLTRFTILSNAWHQNNPTAANYLFGSKTWDETKELVEKRFPELRAKEPSLYMARKGRLEMSDSSEFESVWLLN